MDERRADHPSIGQEPANRSAERRRFGRIRVLWNAAIETLQGPTTECLVLELSANGARLRMAVPFEPSTRVRLWSYHFGALRGRVVWQQGRQVGLAFDDDAATVVELLAQPLPEILAA